LHAALSRSSVPDRVPFMELFADNEVMAAVLGKRLNYFDKKLQSRRQWEERMLALIEFYEMLGYDYVRADTRDYEITVMQFKRDEELLAAGKVGTTACRYKTADKAAEQLPGMFTCGHFLCLAHNISTQ
jgi:hypothetical protein